MSNQTANLLIAFVVGVPIVLMVLFVIRQLWREFNFKSKIGGWLLAVGILSLPICLYGLCFSYTPQDFLEEELMEVRGTVESATLDWEYSNHLDSESFYNIQVEGHSYVLKDNWGFFRKFSDFNPNRWVKEAEGQTVELTIVRYVEYSTLDHYSGTIYGIRDEAGNVILDTNAHRERTYRMMQGYAILLPLFTLTSAVMLAAGIYITFKLKW